MTDPKRHRFWHGLLILLSIAAPFAAVMLSHWATKTDTEAQVWSSATICGVIIGLLVALKSGRINHLMFGPAFGLAAGMLDLRVAIGLYEQLGWSMSAAAYVPVWGFVLGTLVAWDRPSWRSRCLVVAVISGADFVSRWLWQQHFLTDWLEQTGQWRWLVSAAVFVATSVLAVLLTIPSRYVATRMNSDDVNHH